METAKKITEEKTRIVKSMRDGWEGKTTRTEKGQTFEILTMKNYSGAIVTTATKVTKSNSSTGFVVTSFGMNDEFMRVNHGKIRATEKAIREAHFKGLAEFDMRIQEAPQEEIKKDDPQLGDVVFLDGYGKTKGDDENHWIIYDIKEGRSLKEFFCIEKDTLELRTNTWIRPFSERFGIGIYFEKGFNMASFGIDQNRLSDMLIEAQKLAKIKAEEAAKEEAEAIRKAAEKREYLSQFEKADRRKTTNIIKRYCKENFNISKIEVSTDVFSGGDSMDVNYYSPERIPELERFIKSFQDGHFNSMEDIYEFEDKEEVIISGYILQTYKYVSVYHREGEGKTAPQKAAKIENKHEEKELSKSRKAEIIHNIEKNGIEIKFPSKPEQEILSSLKELGFRWSRFKGVWWAKYSEAILQQVQENLK